MPVVAEAVVALVITGKPGLTVKARVAVPMPEAFVALNAAAKVPVAVGVPVIAPVLALTLNPEGKPVADRVVGLLVAVMA